MLIDFHSLTPKAQKLLNGFWCREAESLHPVTNGLRPQSFTNSAKSLPIAKNDRGSRRSRVRLRTGIANRLSTDFTPYRKALVVGSSPRPALADLAAALECNPLPVDAILEGRSDLAPPGIPAGMTADHRASEFLEKCHGLPLTQATAWLSRGSSATFGVGYGNTAPTKQYSAPDDGWKIRVFADGRFDPVI